MISFKPLYGLLAERRMTSKDLSEAAGIKVPNLYRIRKTNRATVDEIDAICRALKCGIPDVMRYEAEDD